MIDVCTWLEGLPSSEWGGGGAGLGGLDGSEGTMEKVGDCGGEAAGCPLAGVEDGKSETGIPLISWPGSWSACRAVNESARSVLGVWVRFAYWHLLVWETCWKSNGPEI